MDNKELKKVIVEELKGLQIEIGNEPECLLKLLNKNTIADNIISKIPQDKGWEVMAKADLNETHTIDVNKLDRIGLDIYKKYKGKNIEIAVREVR